MVSSWQKVLPCEPSNSQSIQQRGSRVILNCHATSQLLTWKSEWINMQVKNSKGTIKNQLNISSQGSNLKHKTLKVAVTVADTPSQPNRSSQASQLQQFRSLGCRAAAMQTSRNKCKREKDLLCHANRSIFFSNFRYNLLVSNLRHLCKLYQRMKDECTNNFCFNMVRSYSYVKVTLRTLYSLTFTFLSQGNGCSIKNKTKQKNSYKSERLR